MYISTEFCGWHTLHLLRLCSANVRLKVQSRMSRTSCKGFMRTRGCLHSLNSLNLPEKQLTVSYHIGCSIWSLYVHDLIKKSLTGPIVHVHVTSLSYCFLNPFWIFLMLSKNIWGCFLIPVSLRQIHFDQQGDPEDVSSNSSTSSTAPGHRGFGEPSNGVRFMDGKGWCRYKQHPLGF